MPARKIAIVVIATSVYLKYFRRFSAAVRENFAPGTDRHFFLFTDNVLPDEDEDVTVRKICFLNRREVKLNRHRWISDIEAELREFDLIFHCDVDSVVAEPISIAAIDHWFAAGRALAGVVHPWTELRETKPGFERNPASAAHVGHDGPARLPYHQACFWGGRAGDVMALSAAVQGMIDRDARAGQLDACEPSDESYLNKYFVSMRRRCIRCPHSHAHPAGDRNQSGPGNGYPDRLFGTAGVIVHDNASQTQSWKHLDDGGASFRFGAFAQFYKTDLASCLALQAFRKFNPANPIHLISDGGDDLAALARKFDCSYVHETVTTAPPGPGTGPRTSTSGCNGSARPA